MSIKLMTMVFDRYPKGGGEMILALALADHAHDDGTNIYPSIRSLAEKTRQSERTIQYQLRRMEESGWLILVNSGNGGRNQRREYVINPNWIKGADIAPLEKGATDDTKGATDDTKGCNSAQERVQPVAPAYNHHRTVIEPSNNHHTGARKKCAAVNVELPNWLPEDVWDDWVEHRKAIKAPLTQRAAELSLKKLDRFRAEGHCPIAIIEQSVMSGKWTDLYPIRDRQTPQRTGKSSGFDPVAYVNRNRTQPGDFDAIDV